MVRMGSRSRSRSRSPRERLDRFGRSIPSGKRSRSRSRSRERYRRSRSPRRSRHSRDRSRSSSRSRSRSSFPSSYRPKEVQIQNKTNIEDPRFLNARIFIGNLPSDRTSKAELENLFQQYGKILGVSIHDRGFGFVQYECEEDAKKAQIGENGTKLNGQVLDVKMAAEGRKQNAARGRGDGRGRGRGEYSAPGYPPGRERSPVRPGDPYADDRYRDHYARREPPPRDRPDVPTAPPPGARDDPYFADPYRRAPPPPDDPYRDPYRDDPYRRDPYRRDPYDDPYFRDPYRDPYHAPPPPPKKQMPADVQIICMNKQLAQYAESLESRLRQNALIVDIVVIPEDMQIPQMVEEAAKLKCLFAITINSQNEAHKSLTLNILHGTPQEHRNMPMEDAMKLVATSFEKYIQIQREKVAGPPAAGAVAAPAAASTPTPPFLPPSADVSYLLNLLADNRQLTIEELEKVIQYLIERKDKLTGAAGRKSQVEGVPSVAPTGVPAPSAGDSTSAYLQQQQQELQNKILNILNGSGSGATPVAPQPAVQSQAGGYGGTMGGVPRALPASQSSSNPLINFDNPNVKKALDSLIQSGPNLLKSLPSSVPQSAPARPAQYPGSAQAGAPVRQQPVAYQSPAPAGGQQYGGTQPGYGSQFQQQSPMQVQAPARAAASSYGAAPQRPAMGPRMPQQAARPRY